MDVRLLVDRPWSAGGYWNLRDVPTMLSYQEQKMLHWMASNIAGVGTIVDMGTFLGGSTVCLAQGVRDRLDRRKIKIESYDRYRLGEFEKKVWFVDKGIAIPKDDNFRPMFDENTKHYKDLVTVHEGDVTKEIWHSGLIELLFIDFAKSAMIHDHILEKFFPYLGPGALLIQQDYLWPGTPWIPVAMIRLSSCFQRILSEPCSVVYRCTKTPTAAELSSACWRNIEASERLSMMKQAIAMESDSTMVERLQLSLEQHM